MNKRTAHRLPSRLARAAVLGGVVLLTACGVDQRMAPWELESDQDATQSEDTSPESAEPGAPVSTKPNPGDEPRLEIELPKPVALQPGDPLEPPDSSWTWTAEVVDLIGALPPEAELVGVTIDEIYRDVYLLERSEGIFRFRDGSLEHVYNLSDATADSPPEGDFTDIAALTEDVFFVTAPDDGYILDTARGTLEQHFCYFPPTSPDVAVDTTSISVALTQMGLDVMQVTDALTYDVHTHLIWAQPRTIERESGEVFGSELASFDGSTGEPLNWYLLPEVDLRAGAMTVTSNEVIIAVDSWLRMYDKSSMTVNEVMDLSPFGISGISGLTTMEGKTFHIVTDQNQSLYIVKREPHFR